MALIAWYKLDGNLVDEIGDNHLTYERDTGKLVSEAGKIGGCYKRDTLNSGTDFFRTTNKIDLQGDFTFSLWTKVADATSSANGLLTHHNHSRNAGAGITVKRISDTDYRICCNTGTGSARTYNTYYGTSNIKDKWSLLTLVFIKETNSLSLWVNGVKEKEITYSLLVEEDYIDLFNWSTNYDNSNNYRPAASIDDVRIYNHALSKKEIKELAKAKILHYTFDEFQEPTENLAPDISQFAYQNYNGRTSFSLYDGVARFECVAETPIDTAFTLKGNIQSVIPSESYSFSFLARAVGLNNFDIREGASYRWNILWKNASGTTIGYSLPSNQLLLSDWQLFSLVGEAPLGASSAVINIGSDSPNFVSKGSYVEIKNIQLEKKDHATPFINGTRTGSVSDNSGYDNHADLALATTPRWTSDSRIGKGAYEFNGTASNYIVFPHTSIGLPSLTNCTISFWRKKTTAGGWLLLRGQTNSHYVMATSSGTGNFYHSNAGTSWQIFVDGVIRANPIDDTNWHHYVMRNVDLSTWTELTLNNYSSWYFRGILDDFRIYNTVLTDDDIKELYQTRAQIDNRGNFFANNIEEPANIASIVNKAIVNKTFTNGVSSYTQANCQVSLTDNGYRIYRPANLIYPDAGRTMWGGLKINLFNNEESKIEKGKRYRISFLVNGKTSNSPGGVYFSNYMGWSGGGLTNVGFSYNDTIPTNFNGVKRVVAETNVIDDIYKACTTSYSSFVAGQYYNCYRDLCFGFGYQSTGTLGTDIYITDFKIQEITDNNKNSISENGIAKMFEISEIGPANGLVAYYPLNGDANDYANANDGTVNGAIISAGINGKACYSFDGVDDQINLLSTNSVDPEQGTVSAWFYMNGAQVNHATLFACQDGPSWANMRVNLGADGTTAIRFAVGNGTSSITNACSSGTITQNEWHHALGTYDGANIRIYIDGMLKNTVASTITPGTFTPNYTGIGFMNYATRYWKGQIQDVRIYNRALSAEEITILYDLEKPNPTQMKIGTDSVYISGEFDERL